MVSPCDDQCLSLGLSFLPSQKPRAVRAQHHPQPPGFEPETSLTLSLSGETAAYHQKAAVADQERERDCVSAASSLSNTTAAAVNHSGGGGVVSVKRERETASSEDLDMERGSEEDDGTGPTNPGTRKKLRLTKDQSALLEESFKQHSTLNPKQKQALADRLNLRPRQVEVWFQNRRARTKLKQTEVDCEYLKKCCETLTDENRRLQKELAELKALKMSQPPPALYMHLPAATLTMCPSCERIGGGGPAIVAGGAPSSKGPLPFSMAGPPKPAHHFIAPFPNPSAAC